MVKYLIKDECNMIVKAKL